VYDFRVGVDEIERLVHHGFMVFTSAVGFVTPIPEVNAFDLPRVEDRLNPEASAATGNVCAV